MEINNAHEYLFLNCNLEAVHNKKNCQKWNTILSIDGFSIRTSWADIVLFNIKNKTTITAYYLDQYQRDYIIVLEDIRSSISIVKFENLLNKNATD